MLLSLPRPERWKSLGTSKASRPTSKSARRAVTFNEDIQTIPITSRMDRLTRLLEDEAEEQRHQNTTALRHAYDQQLRDIQRQQEQEKDQQKKRRVLQVDFVPIFPFFGLIVFFIDFKCRLDRHALRASKEDRVIQNLSVQSNLL